MLRPITMSALISVILSGCAAPQGEFPSLLRRPYEINSPVLAPAVTVSLSPPVLPAALADQVAALAARHRSALAGYLQLLPAASAAAREASGAGVGSEAWAAAHLEVSRLDKARADSKAALAQLDQLITAQLDSDASDANTGLAGLLTEYQTPIAADTAAQDAEIDRLSRMIGM